MSGPTLSSVALGADLLRREDHVIDRASRLPLETGAHVTLMHVLRRDAPPAAEAVAAAGLRARGAVLLARRPDVDVEVMVGRGERGEQLARTADEARSELLVVGRDEPPRRLGMRTPSTAERAARRTDVPVLAVRPGPVVAYRRVLVAIESPGDASAHSIEIARRLLEEGAGEGDVVYALDDAIERRMHRAGAPRPAVVMARRWLRARSRAEISSWLERSFGAHGLHVRLERGDPSRVILGLAGRTRPDLLVLGVDHGWLRGRFLRSSLAGDVLLRAEGDVLIVRTSRARDVANRSRRAAA
jgi:nucleotide-binding universal stress UspA family protein